MPAAGPGTSLLGPPPRLGPRGFIPPGLPLQHPHGPPGNPPLNIPRHFLMGSRMPPPPMMIHPPLHQMHHNPNQENHHPIHLQNPSHRPKNVMAIDMPSSPDRNRNRDTDDRFAPSSHYDEDLRHDFKYDELPYDNRHENRHYDERPPFNQRPDMRFNDRPFDERRNHFEERGFDDMMYDERRPPRRDDINDHWRRDENEFRPNFNSDTDFRSRKRMWKEGPGDGPQGPQGPHHETHPDGHPPERMWNRITSNGKMERDHDRMY